MQVNLCINTCRSDDGWHQMYLMERRDKVLAECVSLSCHSQVDMKVEREKLSDQLIQMFSKESTCKYFGDRFPFVEFKGERAVDMDGVTRELFSLFGDQIRLRYFESNTEMIPRVDPQTCGSDDHIYLSMGRILSYGFVLTGFFPIFLAKVSILSALCDNANISDETLLSSFLNYIDDFEHDAVKKMQSDDGSDEVREDVMLSRFQCYALPHPGTITDLVLSCARSALLCKPAHALKCIVLGMRGMHACIWEQVQSGCILSLYTGLIPRATRVWQCIVPPQDLTQQQDRMLDYLRRLLFNLST